MPDSSSITRRQQTFLRALRTHPSGPPQDQWPTPAVFRRWLRRPAFRSALASVQSALRFQTDFLVATAAANAARSLDNPDQSSARQLADLLRLSHLRHRFNPQSSAPPPEDQRPGSLPVCAKCSPIRRLSHKKFDEVAIAWGYAPPLAHWPQFPAPVPQDTFYYRLLLLPETLLWYLKLYNEQTPDRRYDPILQACRHLVPKREDYTRLPDLATCPPPDTDTR